MKYWKMNGGAVVKAEHKPENARREATAREYLFYREYVNLLANNLEKSIAYKAHFFQN